MLFIRIVYACMYMYFNVWHHIVISQIEIIKLSDSDSDSEVHRSRSNVQKMTKVYKMGHISDAISPTDFILGTKVQPNKAHSMTQVLKTLTEGKGQGQILPKMVKN